MTDEVWYRGALGRVEEGGDREERRADDVDDGERPPTARQHEAEREGGAREVGGDHHAAAVHAVNDDARDGAEQEERQVARNRVEGDGAPDLLRVGELDGEREDGDVVQPVADLGDDLPRPEPAEVGVLPEQAAVGQRVPPRGDCGSLIADC